jgi:hypothetical protein
MAHQLVSCLGGIAKYAQVFFSLSFSYLTRVRLFSTKHQQKHACINADIKFQLPPVKGHLESIKYKIPRALVASFSFVLERMCAARALIS